MEISDGKTQVPNSSVSGDKMTLQCAVFASGSGSNFQTMLDKSLQGDLHAKITVLIGNNSKAGAFARANRHGIPSFHLAPSHFESETIYCDKLLSILEDHHVELIVLAGYMKKLPSEVVRAYKNRIVNIHPALLPAFGGKGMYGIKVHEEVIAYGVKITGVTVHFVDEEYDHGPIIYQRSIDVRDSDDAHSLAERVLTLEHDSYWRAIELIAQRKLRIEGRRVLGNG